METLMNIYEIADRLIDIECALNDEDAKLILRNASNMLKAIETYVNKMPDWEDNEMYIKNCLTDIIYPLD